MSEEKKKQSNEKQENINKPIPPIAHDDNKGTSNKQDNTHNETERPKEIKRETNKNKRAVLKWVGENWDKVAMVAITGLLAYYTYALFNEAVSSSKHFKKFY